MAYCIECGYFLEDDALVCPRCDMPQTAASNLVESQVDPALEHAKDDTHTPAANALRIIGFAFFILLAVLDMLYNSLPEVRASGSTYDLFRALLCALAAVYWAIRIRSLINRIREQLRG